LAADVLVVPHHGSLTSSSPVFLAAVSPTMALLPVGYRNRYGFPKPQIVQRYRDQHVQLFDTAHNGAIEILLGQARGALPVVTYRQQARRYWHDSENMQIETHRATNGTVTKGAASSG